MEVSHKVNQGNFNNSYDNYNPGKGVCRSDGGRNQEDINDNLSDKANSVQTSYKYRKNKEGPNTISSKDSYRNNHNHYNNHHEDEDDDEISYEISENSNLICPNCINCTLIEAKKKRENLEKNYDSAIDDKNYDYSGLYDRNRNYDRNLIDEKRRQREYNTNEAIQNLARINAGMSNKDKLIQINENSRNPLNEGRPDYQYQRFQDEYNRRQKMINENLNKYYPNMNNERPEITSYYDNYVYNPKYNGNKKEGYNNIYDDHGPNNINKREYIKDLEDQINYKNELKKREKEEERKRGQKQFEDIQKELKREEEERIMKERKQKDELIKANMELINQKNKMKLKELEDKLKYRELCDRQNEEYQKELQKQQLEKERIKEDIYNQNKNEYERKQKMKEREKELYDKVKRGYDDDYDNRGIKGYDERRRSDDRYDKRDERGYYGGKYYDKEKKGYDDGRGGKGYDDGRYDGRRGKGYDDGRGGKGYDDGRRGKGYDDGRGEKEYDDGKYDIKDKGKKHKIEERMGRCCRCHRIFPRRLLTINRYFYKENRK